MYKNIVSAEKIRCVLTALDKHFDVKDWSFTVKKEVSGKSRISLCWRLVRPSKTVIFCLRSLPLSNVPAWAYYGVIYRFEKVKKMVLNGELKNG